MAVADRAVRRVRLLTSGLLVLGAACHRPTAGEWPGRLDALVVGLGAAAVLAGVSALSARAARSDSPRASRAALLAAGFDAALVVGAVCLFGLPPHSFTVVLLLLPLLESALWAGLAGLAGTWALSSAVLCGYTVATAGPRVSEDVGALLVTLPVLLLATIPLALLAEYLVAEVAGLAEARQVADDRADLLGGLSTVTAELFAGEPREVAAQLVAGAVRLGAPAAVIVAVSEDGAPPVIARAGDDRAGDLGDPGAGPTRSWPLELAGNGSWELRVLLRGRGRAAALRREALDLLVAQGRAALANAALLQHLGELRRDLEQQATRDQLTGLVNRRGLALRVAQMSGPLGVLFCDLDGFKGVNDTLGHAAGDELLCQVATRLEAVVGNFGVIGRLGGDEFAAVVPGGSDAELAELAEALHDGLATPFVLHAGPATVGVSVGTASARSGEWHIDELMERADERMYAAKRERRAAGRVAVPVGADGSR